MGKRIIQQRRGRGTHQYKARKKAFKNKVGYPEIKEGEGEILKIFKSGGHSAPLVKIKAGKRIFINIACEGLTEGQKIKLGDGKNRGDILMLKNAEIGNQIYNIENSPRDGGKLVRTAGSSGIVMKKGDKIRVKLASGKEVDFDPECRATLGVVAAGGRKDKPFVKAGKKFYDRKAKGKLWPRTSAVKMNAVDHPFGCGRGKNVSHGQKGKTPKKNAPAGAKVGSLRPRRSGRKKR